MAVYEVVKGTKELYPGTNIIAILREKALEIAETENMQSQLLLEQESDRERIERWKQEASPMPDDCREALRKAGIRIPEPGGAQ